MCAHMGDRAGSATPQAAQRASAVIAKEPEISGDVSFEAIMQASAHRVDFLGGLTLSVQEGPHTHTVQSLKKKDLANALTASGITDAVVAVYRDNTGTKDLKRMENAGFVIQAQYKGEATPGSSVPPKDFYYMKRTAG